MCEMEPKYKGTTIRTGYLYNVAVNNITINTSSDTFNYNSNSSSFEKLQSSRNFSEINTFSALKLFFVSEDGQDWFTNLVHLPYFYVGLSNDNYLDHVKHFLEQNVKGLVEKVYREDLSRPNHIKNPKLSKQATKRSFLKISFATIDLLRQGLQYIRSIKSRYKDSNAYDTSKLNNNACLRFSHVKQHLNNLCNDQFNDFNPDCLAYIDECYEADVRYITRVLIDKNIRCASWYNVEIASTDNLTLSLNQIDRTILPPLNVLAWDIECYKAPLKFPDMEVDPIILISFMFNGQGYLLVNREYVSHDIEDFSYKPNHDLSGAGTFRVFNEPNEYAIISRFFECVKNLGTHILVTYNGDNFDFPYLYRRAQINNVRNPLANIKNMENKFTRSEFLNMDCYKWVERDSYLPNGSRTLKQVCRIKLKYNPAEVDPEEMITLAINDPQTLATYSVSDAVATYYLYIKFIHNFVLALSYIIPLAVEDVLRQGSGTLCENLLMAEAYAKEIIFPNKHQSESSSYYKDENTGKFHLIYDDSYVGGKVETLRCGLYRDDLPEQFTIDHNAYQQLIDNIAETISHWGKNLNPPKHCSCSVDTLEHNESDLIVGKMDRNLHYFTNIRDIYDEIHSKLTDLKNAKQLYCLPKVIHLDVGAMYPNIILTHRLQPTAIVNEEFCSKCSYYSEAHECQKRMKWKRKIEISPIDHSHIMPILNELKTRVYKPTQRKFYNSVTNIASEDDISDFGSDSDGENINLKKPEAKVTSVKWNQLSAKEQNTELMKAVKAYSLKTTQKSKLVKEVEVESIVCQRENPFYVNTVLKFRDRRYVFKRNVKQAERIKHNILQSSVVDIVKLKEINESILINDSLQLAHKCILNSFYGYVKRNGSRWFSMEMGAIVTFTGSQIIEFARKLIDKIGIAIELDTDGIWCMLPEKFPFIFNLQYFVCTCGTNQKLDKLTFEYPTNMLNLLIDKNWANTQYLEYDELTEKYRIERHNHVEFELDGPWYGMFLPASEKSEELLKKRYVVYNHQKCISELKGFEIKRRGELQLIQRFQEEIFGKFALGTTKQEAFSHAAAVGIRWRRTLDDKAKCISDDMELFDLLMSKSVIKKSVLEQPNMKGFGITTARRLSELLNNPMYIQDRNVSTQFLITNKPSDADKTARAIPIQLFLSEDTTRHAFISKWLKVSLSQASQLNSRDILDWDYYRQRLDIQLLKLICIPCIIQGVPNPIPFIKIPDWLYRKERSLNPSQGRITAFFASKPAQLVDSKDSNKCASKGDVIDLTTQIVECDKEVLVIDSDGEKTPIDVDSIISQEITRLRGKWSFHILNLLRRKVGRIETVSDNLYTFLKGVSMDSLTIDDLYTLFTETWHIIDIQSTLRLGIFKCQISVLNHNKIYQVYITVKRWIYINFEGDLNDLPYEITKNAKVIKVRHSLPKSAEKKTLLQLELYEENAVQSVFTLNALFHNKIRGIYESKIPLIFDFIVRKGNEIAVDKDKFQTAVSDNGSTMINSFNEKSLAGISFGSNSSKYLMDADIRYVYVYHSYTDGNITRFCAIIYSAQNKGEEVSATDIISSLIIVGGSKEITQNVSSEQMVELMKQFKQDYDGGDMLKDYEYQPFPNCINNFSEAIKFDHRSPSISCKNAIKYFTNYLQSLVNLKKCLFIVNTSLEDNNLFSCVYDNVLTINNMTLNFRLKMAPDSTFLQANVRDSLSLLQDDYFNFEEKLALARISGLPINMIINETTIDVARLFLDISYARSLRSFNHILWCNEDTQSTKVIDYDIINNCMLKMTNSGIYRGYVVKIEFDPSIIFHAIRHANKFESVDKSNNLHHSSNEPLKILAQTLDGILKTLMNLYESISYRSFQNIFQTLTNIRAWISDSSSILYDPLLYSQIVICYESYLSQLLLQLKSRFGIMPIYVGSSFAILDTGQVNVEMGRQVIDLAMRSIKSLGSCYESVTFTLCDEYIAVIQLNDDNYIRFKEYSPHNVKNSVEDLPLLKLYPLPIQGFFRDLIDSIVLTPLINTLNNCGQTKDKMIESEELLCTSIRDWWLGDNLYQNIENLLRDRNTFLTEYLNDEDSKNTENLITSLEFPMIPGTFATAATDWKCEAVGLVTCLLEIEKSLNIQKDGELQELLHRFKSIVGSNPHTIPNSLARSVINDKLVLRDMCCTNCFAMSNINITIINNLTICDYCNEPWDQETIELKLIDYLEEFFYALHAQNFRCVYCSHARISYQSTNCNCGNVYADSLDINTWLYAVEIVRKIAKTNEYHLLSSAIKQFDYLI